MRLLFILILFMFVMGCSEDDTLSQRRLIYCSEATPETFNPQITRSVSTLKDVSLHVYDRLLEFNPNTQRLEGSLADHWSVSQDGLTYTFELKKNIAFQSTPWFTPSRYFDARDVLFSFNRMIQSSHPYHFISGGQYPLLSSLDLTELVRDIDAPSPHTVIFELKSPVSSFLSTLASSYAVILSEEYGHQMLHSGTPEYIDIWPVGTGPFILYDFQSGNFIRYQRHPEYWRKKIPLEQVIFDITPKVTARLAKLVTGQCDVMSYPTASQIPTIKKNPKLTLVTKSSMNTAYLILNTRKSLLNDAKVRQAMAMAINKKKLLQVVYFQKGSIADSVISPLSWAYNFNLDSHRYDPDRALKILQENYPDTDFLFDLWVQPGTFPYNPNTLKTAQLIQSDLAAIGITIRIQQYQWRVMQPLITLGQHDLMLFGWTADNPDPDGFFRQFFSCLAIRGGYNFSRWCSRKLDANLDQALTSLRLDERIYQYQLVQEILNAQVPVIPLTHAPHLLAFRREVEGLTLSTFGEVEFYQVTEK